MTKANNKTSLIILILSLVVFLGLGQALEAQTLADFGNSLSVVVAPKTPGANTNTTISIEDYSTDLTRSNISWSVNGKTLSSGVGQQRFSFVTGAIGKTTTVAFSITLADGTSYGNSLSFIPAGLDLIWEADTTAPPLYKGKRMASGENVVRVIALPYFIQGGSRIPSEKLYYSWEKDFEVLPSASGVGKSSANIKISSIFGDTSVKVKVSTLDGSVQAEKLITINPINPFVLVYVVDPLAGTNYEQPIGGSIDLYSQEITLVAEPFFFPLSHTKTPGLSYTWGLGGQRIETDPLTPNSVTLRSGTESGQSNISLAVRDPFDSLITAATNFVITFSGSDIFQ